LAGRPNYRGKRLDRERKKAAKRAAKQADKVERTALRQEGSDGMTPDDTRPDDTPTESALNTQPRSAGGESPAE
jgi:hypothetical protein